MNRRDFFTILIKELKNIEPSELQDVLQYYNEYFDDAGLENEQSVIEELGSPQKIAAAIKATATIKYYEVGEQSPKKSFKAMWITIGAIFAAPIALPIAFAFAILFVSLLFTFAVLLLSFFSIAVAFLLSGGILIAASFFVIAGSPPAFISLLGLGMFFAGLGLLAFIGTLALSRVSFKAVILFTNHNVLRRSKTNV